MGGYGRRHPQGGRRPRRDEGRLRRCSDRCCSEARPMTERHQAASRDVEAAPTRLSRLAWTGVCGLLMVSGLLLGMWALRQRGLPAETERKALAGGLRVDPRLLVLERQERIPLMHTRRVWRYCPPTGLGAHFRTFDSQLRAAGFHERLPRVRTAGAWSAPLALPGAPTWAGIQRHISSGEQAPLTPEARDLAFLALGSVLGLVVTDAEGRNLYPSLDWSGVPTEYPSGQQHVDVILQFEDPPPEVPGQARCSLILDTGQVDSVEMKDW